MKIEEIATIIEESSKQIVHNDECLECCSECKETIEARSFVIETVSRLLDYELFSLGALVLELGNEVFSENEVEENFISEKLESEKHLNAIRKLAEMKIYFEAQNRGELQEKTVV